MRLSDALAGATNNRIGVKHPLVSGGLTAFGQSLRVQIVAPPAVERGASISIREYVSRILDLGEISFPKGRQVSVEARRLTKPRGIAAMAKAGRLCDARARRPREPVDDGVEPGGVQRAENCLRPIRSSV